MQSTNVFSDERKWNFTLCRLQMGVFILKKLCEITVLLILLACTCLEIIHKINEDISSRGIVVFYCNIEVLSPQKQHSHGAQPSGTQKGILSSIRHLQCHKS